MDWQAYIYDSSENIIDTFHKLAYRQFYDEELAKDAVANILLKWMETNWASLNKFEGRNSASPKTYLVTAFKSRLIDEHRKLFGRCMPPVWVARLGNFWTKIHKQLCCEQKDPVHIISIHQETNSEDEILRIIDVIKEKDSKCLTQSRGNKVSIHGMSEDMPDMEFKSPSVEDEVDTGYYNDVINALTQWLSKSPIQVEGDCKDLFRGLNDLSLDDEVVVLLRLVYQEGYSVPNAADFIRMKPHTARRRINDAVESIGAVFSTLKIEI